MRWIPVIRWLLVVPASGVGFAAASIVTLSVYKGLSHWCPWGEKNSGMCSWPDWVDTALMCTEGGLAALLVVSLGVIIAPNRKAIVAWLLYALGSAIAVYLLYTMWRYHRTLGANVGIGSSEHQREETDLILTALTSLSLGLAAALYWAACAKKKAQPPTTPYTSVD